MENARPRFSVLTPTFNARKWISLNIASVADQGFPVEHLIQDGKSTDGTSELISAENSNAVTGEDGGMYDALNRALERASGEIIGHLNADEQYLPGTLARVDQIFRDNPSTDIVCGDMILINDAFQPSAYRRSVLPPRNSAGAIPLQVPTCALFYHRRVIAGGIRYRSDLRIVSDAVFIDDLLKSRFRWQFDRRPYSAFVVHSANLSNDLSATAERSELSTLDSTKKTRLIGLKSRIWLKKLLAGAYAYRRVHAEIFTHGSLTKRESVSKRVGWRWSQR